LKLWAKSGKETAGGQKRGAIHYPSSQSWQSQVTLREIPLPANFKRIHCPEKLEEIIYCEAERSYTVFHLENGKTVTVSKPLIGIRPIIEGHFFSPHS
jgi:hypothetical protein